MFHNKLILNFYFSPQLGKPIVQGESTRKMSSSITKSGWRIRHKTSLMLLVCLIVLIIEFFIYLFKFLSFTVEAYKKGAMKGGAAIPPPNMGMPGSKIHRIEFVLSNILIIFSYIF